MFSYVMQNKADYEKRWYRVGKFEMAIYEKLKVNKWKGKMRHMTVHCLTREYTHGMKLHSQHVRQPQERDDANHNAKDKEQ